jgi:trimethylamine---corrinoid protein Co-methyltransferase
MPRKGIKCGNLNFLSDKQINFVHEQSFKFLASIGIRVEHREAIEIYYGHGCSIDKQDGIVKIPEAVLEKYLKMAPSSFTLYGKNPGYDLNIDCKTAFLMSGAAAVRLLDLDGKYREPDLTDLMNLTRLQDALPNVDVVCPMVIPNNVEPTISELYISIEAMKGTYKNCDLWVHSAKEVDYQVKAAEIITGKPFKERPIFTNCICLISPLVQPADVLDALLESVKLGVPVYIEVDDMMGATSPVTMMGTLIQQSINILAGVVLAQMTSPGAPCFYSIASAAMDMQTANYIAADPITVLLHAATAQIAHHYNLPFNGGTGLDSKTVDIQAGYERAFQNLACVASGVNIVHLGTGMLEQMMMTNYELCVIDDEVFGMTRKLFDEENFACDIDVLALISNVFQNKKGSYFSEDHTFLNFRKNLWPSRVTDRNSFHKWKTGGCRSSMDVANAIARDILDRHHPEVVSESKMGDLKLLLAEAKNEIVKYKK